MNKLKYGHRVSIIAGIAMIVVLLSIIVLRFSWNVISISFELGKISNEISSLEYEAEEYAMYGWDRSEKDQEIRERYQKRDALVNSDDSITRFLVTSTGSDNSELTKQNRHNRDMFIAVNVIAILSMLVINFLVLRFCFMTVKNYIITRKRQRQEEMRRRQAEYARRVRQRQLERDRRSRFSDFS